MTFRSAGVCAISVLALAGCASSDQALDQDVVSVAPPTSTGAPENPSVGVTGSPDRGSGEMTIEEAGDLYLRAVCPSNEYDFAIYKMVEDEFFLSKEPVSQQDRDFFSAAAEVSRQSAMALDSPERQWPTDVQAGIDEVITSLLQGFSKYGAAAKAEMESDAWFAIMGPVEGGVNSNSQAQLVRIRLNLPPAGEGIDGCAPFQTGIR